MGHTIGGKTRFGTPSTLSRIQFVDTAHGLRHFIDGVHQKAGFSVLDQVRQSARAESDHRCAASESLHGNERAGFRSKTGNKQTASAVEKIALSASANLADQLMFAPKSGSDHLFEIQAVRLITEDCACEIK